jgi:Cu/Ag efflux protein CusF
LDAGAYAGLGTPSLSITLVSAIGIRGDAIVCLMPAKRVSIQMIARFYRPLVMGLLPIALIACMSSGPTVADDGAAVPLGVDLGGSGPVATSVQSRAPTYVAPDAGHAAHSQHGGEMQMAHAGHNDAHGTGTVNAVDPTQHKINLSHRPISELGWPAMTMEFPVAASVDLKAIKPGTRVNFTIEQSQGGMYEIKAITPAGGGQ